MFAYTSGGRAIEGARTAKWIRREKNVYKWHLLLLCLFALERGREKPMKWAGKRGRERQILKTPLLSPLPSRRQLSQHPVNKTRGGLLVVCRPLFTVTPRCCVCVVYLLHIFCCRVPRGRSGGIEKEEREISAHSILYYVHCSCRWGGLLALPSPSVPSSIYSFLPLFRSLLSLSFLSPFISRST